MAEYPVILQELISALKQLPAIGPRSAERLALYLIQGTTTDSFRLADAIRLAREKIHPCIQCGFFAEEERCPICKNPKRDQSLWCIVEQASDVLKFEKSGIFHGLYHVLGGRLSPLDQIGPEQLSIISLLERIKKNPPQEIILALNADVEGETTALYLVPLLKEFGIKISRLATGLPAAGGLEFADNVTLGYALQGRKEI